SWVPTPANRRRANAVAVIDSKVQSMINQRRATGEDKGDLLSMLLLSENEEDGTRMNDKQVRDEAMTLFLAGHETTANALSWALYLIAQHPEVEAKLIEEVDRVLGRRAATVSDLRQLTYTDMVIKEAMRLYPPAWIFTRMALEDFELGMYTIPKGSIILMSPYAMHRHPDYWEHPTEFQPERFHAGWENEVPKYAYVPFGGGPRICIGNSFATMEANLVLATIMQHSTLSLVPNRTTTPEPLITLRPNPGIDMQIKLRDAVPA
ncbi:MAG: cytochrome P450, partial [Anaerolineae bacterium]|nr:cytochrome P450 [Anaerolineae bacterium]